MNHSDEISILFGHAMFQKLVTQMFCYLDLIFVILCQSYVKHVV